MEIVEKKFKTTSGRHLVVYDNVVEMSQARFFKSFVENSIYKLGSVTSEHFENNRKNETFFQSPFTLEEIENFGIFPLLQSKLPNYLLDYKVTCGWVNATFSGNSYRYHTDIDQAQIDKPRLLTDCIVLTVLYYCNIRWNMDDGGETIFCDDNGDPEIAVGFKPSRVIIFDSHIPHKPCFTKSNENDPRFCFTLGLRKLQH